MAIVPQQPTTWEENFRNRMLENKNLYLLNAHILGNRYYLFTVEDEGS